MDTGYTFISEISDTNENGMGIARHEGMVVFVPGLIAGETAEIRIIASEKNYSLGECVRRLTASDERIDPLCPSADLCGGCTLGFVSYDLENSIKQNTVKSALRRAGLDYSLVRDTVYSESPYGYRNKVVLHFDPSKKTFGYTQEKSHSIIDFGSCLLCSGEMNEVIGWTNRNIDLIAKLSPVSLHVRSSLDGVTVSLYTETDNTELFDGYKTAIMAKFSTVSDVLYFPGSKKNAKRSYIHDRIFGIDMIFTSEAFRQVNSTAFEKLLSVVHGFASEKNFSRGADLYCGSGIIGLSLAKRFPDAKFWGIEINEDAVHDAGYNARNNGIGNIEFFAGDAASFRKRIRKNDYPELIVVDPPRAGLSKEMRRDLSMLSPARIIYVSCNPQTMARDAAELCGFGYELRCAVPVNMFPRTKHVECVSYFTK